MTKPVEPFSWTGSIAGNLCSADVEWDIDFTPKDGYQDNPPSVLVSAKGRVVTVSANEDDSVSPGELILTPTVRGKDGSTIELEQLVMAIQLKETPQKLLVGGNIGNVYLFRASSAGVELLNSITREKTVFALDSSPDGNYFAVGSNQPTENASIYIRRKHLVKSWIPRFTALGTEFVSLLTVLGWPSLAPDLLTFIFTRNRLLELGNKRPLFCFQG